MAQKDYMNIAISISDGFFMPSRVMLHSLFRQASRPVRVILLYNSLRAENRAALKETADSFGGEFREIYIDEKYFKGASLDNNPLYSIEIYYRILLPYLTEEDRILWLDADIVVNGDITELYRQDVADKYLAAVTDAVEEQGGREEIKRKMGISGRTYFNSGVLLLNTKKIREEIPQNRFFDAIARFNDILKCPDQDILNLVLGGECRILPVRYNYQHHTDGGTKAENGLIIHYIWTKPWNTDYTGHLEQPFWDEAAACGYGKEYARFRRQRKFAFWKNELFPAAIAKFRRKK